MQNYKTIGTDAAYPQKLKEQSNTCTTKDQWTMGIRLAGKSDCTGCNHDAGKIKMPPNAVCPQHL